jgi:hypothetical protein
MWLKVKYDLLSFISGFRRFLNVIFALLACYEAEIYSYLPTFWGQPIGHIFKGQAVQEEFIKFPVMRCFFFRAVRDFRVL